MDLLSTMGDVLIRQPLWALLPAVVFVAAGLALRSRVVIGTAAIWGLYAGYEELMRLRILCSGECNIRIDLLVIYPFLLLLSGMALVWIGKTLLGTARRS
jgi:hypothetical protein